MKNSEDSGILVLEHFDFENPGPGGIEPIIRAMSETDSVQRWTIVGVSSNAERVGTWRRQQCNSVELNFLPILYLDKDNRQTKKFPDSLLYILKLLRLCRGLKPRVIHAHRIEIGLIASFIWPRTPVVVFIHNESHQLSRNSNSSSFWRFAPSLHSAVTELTLIRSNRIIVFNEFEYRRLSAKKSMVFRSYSWFDPDVFKLNNIDQDSSSFIISWVGRLETEKDPFLFLESLRVLREASYDFKANVIGSGTLLRKLQDLSSKYELEPHVNFLGSIQKESLASMLSSSTVLVQTSHYEGSPTSLIESLACGTPVVSTFTGDPDEVIIDGLNGYRIKNRNPSTIAEAILKSREISRSEISATVSHRSKTFVLMQLLSLTTQFNDPETEHE